MIDLTTIPDLKGWVRAQRREGRRIGLVPTMGYLHEGHLALVDEARRRADVVLMSIFVNPLQFGPTEDLARYPRDLPRDRRLAEARGVDALFVPSEAVMYPPGSEIRVVAGAVGRALGGRGAAGPLRRRADGGRQALPSGRAGRGVLRAEGRAAGRAGAPDGARSRLADRARGRPHRPRVRRTRAEQPERLPRSGAAAARHGAERRLAGGARGVARRRAEREGDRGADAAASSSAFPEVQVEYIAVAEPDALAPVTEVQATTVVALAARVGRTRLIDNIILGEGVV